MAEKTIALTGAEVKIEYGGGCNAWLRNDGAATVYAAKAAGITAGADGVVAVPAGGSAPLYGADGTVFLLGTGSVQLIGSDYSTNPFKTSTASGGSGVDDVARAAVEAHAGNADIHVTAAEKAAWNGKADKSDIPTSLPANGGNADTLDGKHAEDFKILTFVDNDAEVTCIEARRDNTVIRLQIQTNMEIARLFKSTDGGASWTGLPLGAATNVGAYTEEKIAALEARIAALEGGGT